MPDLLVYHRRRIDFLHVVEHLQRVEQLLHARPVIAVQHGFAQRFHRDFRQLGLEPGLFQPLLHRGKIVRPANHFDRAVFVGKHVLGARLQRRLHHLVLARARRENELAAVLEHEADRAVGAQVAAVLDEGVAHIGHGAGAVVGEAVDHHRRAGDAVAFIAHLLVVGAFERARAALGGVLDVVLGHVDVARFFDRQAQARVHVGVGSPHARRHGDLPDQAGENLAPLGVSDRLLVLDIGPLGMSRHDYCPDFLCQLIILALRRARAS